MKTLFLAISILILSNIEVLAIVINIPLDQPTIQDGIDSAIAGDTVLVADGIFSGTGNRGLTFDGKAILLTSENGPDSTIIDCGLVTNGFTFDNSEDSNSILNGFTIRNGNANLAGGGIRIVNSSPIISNCKFIGNLSIGAIDGAGGGIVCLSSSPIIRNCLFLDNSAGTTQGYTGGGAIFCKNSNPLIVNSIFINNKCIPFGGGGAIYFSNSSPLISSCTFINNTQSTRSYGTLLLRYSSFPVLEKCIIAFGDSSSAIICDDSSSIPTISCTNIFGNYGGDWVGCISGMENINNNFSSDPLFCDTSFSDFSLDGSSLCAERNSSCGALVGAIDVDCNCCLVGGDVDYSGSINISDITKMVNTLFKGGDWFFCEAEADIDGNQNIDISDLTYLVGYIFKNNSPPANCSK